MLTLEQVQAEARKVVEQFGPDKVNPPNEPGQEVNGCSYTNPDGEHCVAGQILVNLGVPVPDYGEVGNQTTTDGQDMFVDTVEQAAREWLALMQREADGGNTWADCLEAVDGGLDHG